MRILAISGSLPAESLTSALFQAATLVASAGMEVTPYKALGDLSHFNPDFGGERLYRGQPDDSGARTVGVRFSK